MEIEVQTTQKMKKSFETPFYIHNCSYWYKVVSGTQALCVFYIEPDGLIVQISTTSPAVAFANYSEETWHKCTEAEFNNAYDKAAKKIRHLWYGVQI